MTASNFRTSTWVIALAPMPSAAEAVMVQCPFLTAVMTPFSSTVAIFLSEVVQTGRTRVASSGRT